MIVETPTMLARRLVEIGEAHNVMRELRKLLPTETGPLEIKIDASAVDEAIEQVKKDLGVYADIDKTMSDMVPFQVGLIDRIGNAHRVAEIAFHERDTDPARYRKALLLVAALTVKAIHIHDEGQANDQRS